MLLTVALVSEAFEDLKGRLEPWKEALKKIDTCQILANQKGDIAEDFLGV